MTESVPTELRSLVEHSIAPGTRLESAGKSSDQRAWWFKLRWRERKFDLWIREVWWQDQGRDLIALLARIAAPAPEAALSRHRFWVRLKTDTENDGVHYRFALLRSSQGQEISVGIKISGTARGMLIRVADQELRLRPEYEISVALMALKDQLPKIGKGSQIELHSKNLDTITKRPPTSDEAIREYTGAKLYQAYQGSSRTCSLAFSKHDLDYLGVSKEDFVRAVSLVDGEDWNLRGMTLAPRREFLKRFEKSDLGESTRKKQERELAVKPSPARRIFICHAERDKTIAYVLKEYLKSSDQAIDVFVATHPESLPGGQEWWNRILEKLRGATIVLSIYSPRSKERPWLYFESGGAHLRGTLVIPLAVPPEPKSLPLPLGGLQAYALDDASDVRALVHQVGRTLSVRFTKSEETLHNQVCTAIDRLSAAQSREASTQKAGDTSWRGLLRRAAGVGQLFRVSPIVPSAFTMTTFQVVALKDERVGLRKVDSGHLVDIPPYAVIGVHEENREFFLRINGRLQWIDTDDAWRFMPEAPDPSSPHGLARSVEASSSEIHNLIQKLRANGWQPEFQQEDKAISRLSLDHQLVYGGDGRYLQVPGRPPRLMVKHR